MQGTSEYDRITSVLYPFSGLSKINPEILKNAANRGTIVHKCCDAIMDGMGIDENHEHIGYINSFNQWAEGKEFLDKPGRLFCDKYKISGEIDGLYKNESGVTLFDIKTPVRESNTWSLQGSAYNYLLENSGIEINKIEFIKLDKTGKKPKSFFYEYDFGMFLKCLDIFRRFFKGKKEEDVLEWM